eukprot:scaffold262378_cov28-Tisochrysis_lutea.AAC.5
MSPANALLYAIGAANAQRIGQTRERRRHHALHDLPRQRAIVATTLPGVPIAPSEGVRTSRVTPLTRAMS